MSTDDSNLDSSTTPQYLSGEILNLIAAQVPPEVYVLMTSFAPNRRKSGYGVEDNDQTEIIGTFSTLKLANRAAKAFMEHKIEPFIRAEESYGILPGRKVIVKKFEDGTKSWSLTEKNGEHESIVKTFKETVYSEMWSKEDMPLPLHCHREHDDMCPCCNTAEEIEATKKAKAEADKREFQRDRKRRKIQITRELMELEKDKDLDAVDLEEETDPEDGNATEDRSGDEENDQE